MSKAIAVQAVFLIAVIVIMLFFIVAIFWGWIDTTKFTTSQATCEATRISYCSALKNKLKPSAEWDIGCSQYNIEKPTSPDDCFPS